MKIYALYSIVTAVVLVAPHHAQAQAPILHFPMEATEENGGKVYTNNDGSATVVEGRIGNALRFTGEAVFAKPFRFDRKFYPQVTITAWIKQPAGPLGTRTIFNSGNKVNFVLRNGGGTLSMSADGPGVNHFRSKVPTEEWSLVAAVHDAQTGETRLHLGDDEPTRENVSVRAPGEPRLYGNPDAPNIATMPDTDKEPYIFIGGNDALTYYGASGELIIDDVRIYAGLLSEEQIASIRTATIEPQLAIQAIGETEKNLINGPSIKLPGDQYACRRLPGDQYTCKILPGDQYDFASLPGDQYEYARLPGDQYEPRELPGDQYACRKLPGDQYACKELPGDQYDFRALPGDQYDPRELPGDQYTPRALPGDQYEPSGKSHIRQSVGQIPGALQNPDVRTPGITPDLQSNTDRTVDQVPGEIGAPTVSQLPTGAPKPQYDSAEAADQRAEAEQVQSEQDIQDRQQALTPDLKPTPVGAPQLSALAGYDGEEVDMFDMRTEFIYSMTWWEKNNRPCRLELNSDKVIGCSSLYLSPKNVSLGKGTGIGSLEVCSTSNNNRRVKGIRISGDRINEDGSTTYWPNVSTATRPNCSEWHSAVLCPSDTLATGVVLHRNRGGLNNLEFVGLQLICRAVGMQ